MVDQGTWRKLNSLTFLSSFFSSSHRLRHLLFFLLACGSVFFSGYFFGTFDQSIHIPFLKKDAIPALYPNDPFFELRKTHFSYFWHLFQPFYKLGVLEVSMFVVHLAVTYLTFWAIWRLSYTLFKNQKSSLLCTIAFFFPHIGFAAFPIFEFSLLNRTFVFPFLLLSIDWYLKKEYIKSFVVLGIVYNLHALSATFVLFMYSFDLFLRFFRERWRLEKKAVIGTAYFLFVFFSLPVLLWKFGKSPLDWSLRPEWFGILANSLMYTVFYPLSSSPFVLLLSISGVSAFFLYFLSYKLSSLTQFTRTISNFLYAAMLLICLEVIVSLWLPVTVLVQFQIVRIGVFALLFGYLYFIHSIVKRHEKGVLTSPLARMAYASVLLSPLPLIPFLIEVLLRFFTTKRVLLGGWFFIIGSFLLCAWISFTLQVWQPGIHIFPQKTPWVDVQLWAKKNTPPDALFLTPPEKWWFFDPDWRVYSERSTVATLTEVLEFAFTPEYTTYWKSRFRDVAPGSLERFSGNIFESRRLVEDAYGQMSEDEILRIARKYGVSYIVVKNTRLLPLPLVYENSSFSVYKAPLYAYEAGQARKKLTTDKISHTIQ